jgi:hypothetical protein
MGGSAGLKAMMACHDDVGARVALVSSFVENSSDSLISDLAVIN